MRYLLALALLVSAAAHSAPVPNLVLTCSDENAIGQPQNACHGIWAYQVPTNASVVSSGSLAIWRVFGDLIGADTVYVCTLPVEPGQYSSCRDASGVRRMALVRTDSIVAGGSVTVDKTGADYTDPVAAAQNAFAGDTWCVAPQPDHPCVMAIGEGVFILRETLDISGLVVAGAGKGATLLVADNGVETAVAASNSRLSGLTIVNSQPGGAQTIGLLGAGGSMQLHDAAIHVSGAARNLGVGKRHVNSFEILDSEITAVGQDSTGIETLIPDEPNAVMTVERSLVSGAGAALDETETDIGPTVRLIDSRISGNIRYGTERTLLDILRTEVLGNISAGNDEVRVRITDSYIKGVVGVGGELSGHNLVITDTTIEGVVNANHSFGDFTFDGLQLLGELNLGAAKVHVLRSYISSLSNVAALSLGAGTILQLEQTSIEGALAVTVAASSNLQSSSNVLAGPISASPTAVLSCADTYGADYELLTPSCQPQPP